MISCIYAHINKTNGMIYVGKTENYDARMSTYKSNHHYYQPKLYNATQKYSWNNFLFGEIIEYCSVEQLNTREKYWIRHLNTYDIFNDNMGYNLTEGGEINPMKNCQTAKKVSIAKLGKSMPIEIRLKISKTMKERKIVPSQKNREIVSKNQTNKPRSVEIKNKISVSMKKIDQSCEKNHNSKLTWKKVKEIRSYFKNNEKTSCSAIAEIFNISRSYAHRICQNKVWIEENT